MRLLTVLSATVLISVTGFSGVINQVGTYANWATTWAAISSGNDASNVVDQTLDFVGDAVNPGLYYANNGSYVFFRMRINADTFSTASGAHILLIDVAGYGTNGIDYAFAWDSKSNDNTKHGLEMAVRAKNGPTWGVSQVDDIDGDAGKKLDNDINGSGRTTDGYVRTTDEQSTTAFGNTTFIDFAVSWSYLATYTDLRSNQTWNVGLASIANATDHNAFNADIGGNANLSDSIVTGWAAIPEPTSVMLVSVVGALGFFIRRRFLD
jgi:hypothetical protein